MDRMGELKMFLSFVEGRREAFSGEAKILNMVSDLRKLRPRMRFDANQLMLKTRELAQEAEKLNDLGNKADLERFVEKIQVQLEDLVKFKKNGNFEERKVLKEFEEYLIAIYEHLNRRFEEEQRKRGEIGGAAPNMQSLGEEYLLDECDEQDSGNVIRELEQIKSKVIHEKLVQPTRGKQRKEKEDEDDLEVLQKSMKSLKKESRRRENEKREVVQQMKMFEDLRPEKNLRGMGFHKSQQSPIHNPSNLKDDYFSKTMQLERTENIFDMGLMQENQKNLVNFSGNSFGENLDRTKIRRVQATIMKNQRKWKEQKMVDRQKINLLKGISWIMCRIFQLYG